MSKAEFIGEPITVDAGSIRPSTLGRGAPGCPSRFTWRGREYHVVKVLETSRQLRAHDSDETYVRSHSFRVVTAENLEMVLRCDRRVSGNPWRLFTVKRLEESEQAVDE